MGAARKLRAARTNLPRILAVELVCAARALDLRSPLTPAPGTTAALTVLRHHVPGPGADRWLAPELAAAEALVTSDELLATVAAGSFVAPNWVWILASTLSGFTTGVCYRVLYKRERGQPAAATPEQRQQAA